MIAGVESFLHRLRARISRSEWAIRHFKFTKSDDDANRPGLVLIQIDGLSHFQMQSALEKGRLPFLKSLLEKQEYHSVRMYSGLPSSTPAAQAELFYGVKRAVPAFCYYDKACGRIFSMFEGDDAREMQSRLTKSAEEEPLLKNGSAYADIYTGGAAEAHLCMTKFGWREVFEDASPPMTWLLMLMYIPSLIRIVLLIGVELVLAFVDLFRGLIAKRDFWAELKFIPSRVAVCIVMREILVMRSGIDLLRGLPVVHMNFLGYDEQSHRRGPGSLFAHWSLKGIDNAIKRVHKAAHRSTRRDYDVWVYSDHGQAAVESYQTRTGATVQEAVSRVFDRSFSSRHGLKHGVQLERAKMLRVKRHRAETQPPDRLPIVTALGPLGCVYLGANFSEEERVTMAEQLVGEASIPLVLTKCGDNGVSAWTPSGRFRMPEEASDVLGSDHPFLRETAEDLVELCRHRDAGDFLIAGWAKGADALSFPLENGSHGGPSPDETCAFAIIPKDAALPKDADTTIRLSDIGGAARILMAGREERLSMQSKSERALPDTFRFLTYNVHSCIGMDGSLSPHRIARVIEREDPDIIALQEVDVNRARTDTEDQAQLLANYLGMHVWFHPAMHVKKEKYGEAILSRFPMELRRADALPYRKHWLVDEPRGALWVEFLLAGGARLQVVNTHFGLGRNERNEQAKALMGSDWLGHDDCGGAVILCGDLNSRRESRAYRLLCTRLKDVQNEISGHIPLKTFIGRHPFGYIDHILVNDRIKTIDVRVPCNQLTRVASDHLPLVVDLCITPRAVQDTEDPLLRTSTAETQ